MIEQKIDMLLLDFDYYLKLNELDKAKNISNEIEELLTLLPENTINVTIQ